MQTLEPTLTAVPAAVILSASLAWAASPMELQNAFAEAAAKAKPAVVNLTVTQERSAFAGHPHFFFGDPERLFRTQGTGSGVIIDPRGYILTNEHVIRGASEIEITLTPTEGKPKTYPGKVLGRDPGMDLAVVKIETAGVYPFLKLGDSSLSRVGDWAIAIGSPFELEQTVTVGIISALRQSLAIEGRRYHNLLQTDAAINRGNSGGPLLNLAGEVVGINTAIFSPSGASAGVGFAISSNEAKTILEDLKEGRAIRRGWLGVELTEVDESVRRDFGLESDDGALVNAVQPRSPASRAGIQRGDVIIVFDGRKIAGPADLAHTVGAAAPGKSCPVELVRHGKVLRLRVALDERPSAEKPLAEEDAPQTGSDRGRGYRWEGLALADSEDGVRVESVAPDSKLRGRLREGDLIRGIGPKEVRSLEDFKRLARQINLNEGAVFDLLREGQPLYLSVRLHP